MSQKLVFLHTVSSLIGLFDELSREILPADVQVLHIADDLLFRVVRAQGGLGPFLYRRVADHAIAAEQAGASVVQITCSSISPCAEVARRMVSIPVLRIDEPMVDQALLLGRRIGVVATAPSTLKPTTELVAARAGALGKEVHVDPALCEGALDALLAGDVDTHDRIVRETIERLKLCDDVVLLAQASMARVADAIPASGPVPVLSTPRLAVEHLRDVMCQRTASGQADDILGGFSR